MSNQPITKSALARQLKTSPAMITKYARMGMPVRDDGLVDSKAAETWIAANVHLRIGNTDKGPTGRANCRRAPGVQRQPT